MPFFLRTRRWSNISSVFGFSFSGYEGFVPSPYAAERTREFIILRQGAQAPHPLAVTLSMSNATSYYITCCLGLAVRPLSLTLRYLRLSGPPTVTLACFQPDNDATHAKTGNHTPSHGRTHTHTHVSIYAITPSTRVHPPATLHMSCSSTTQMALACS